MTTERIEAGPAVPADIRDAARQAPEHLFGVVDPAWRGAGTPPVWAVRGQWRADSAGEIAGWLPNPEYLPSPAVRGWPAPTDAVDDALQRACTGYGAGEDLLAALAGAEVSVPLGADDEVLTVRSPGGETLQPVFTTDEHRLRSGAPPGRVMPVARLIADLEHDLLINPGGVVTVVIHTAEVRRFLGFGQPPTS